MNVKLTSLTTQLICADVARSLVFYRDVLGFEPAMHVPEAPPFVWVRLKRDSVEIDLNQREAADYEAFRNATPGGTFAMFIGIEGLDEAHELLRQKVPQAILGLKEQFYGMRELTLRDPDGYYIVLAEPMKK
jgi:catechol 2,3-dioxygenase-like lactoylglutathione lyase family enzyme